MEEHLRPSEQVCGDIVSHQVHPIIETGQGDRGQEFTIAPISLLTQAAITAVYVLPPNVDVERLESAIARTLGIWRIACGRYGMRDSIDGQGKEHFFTLTDSPVTLDVQTFPDRSSAPEPPGKTVLQPLNVLNPFLSLLPPTFPIPNSDTSLLSLRLTLLPLRSVLGIQFSHALGDGASFLRFMTQMSDMYADPTHKVDSAEYPCFGPHVGPLPPVTEEMLARHAMPLTANVEISDAMKVYTYAAATYEPVSFILSQKETSSLKQMVAGLGSEQDAISAFFILLLRNLGHPVEHLSYIINYRSWHTGHPAFPKTLSRLSANVSQMHRISLPPQGELREISQSIRSALNDVRESPDRTLEWLSVCSMLSRQAADKGMMQIVIPPPGWAAINSSYRYDFNVHFGFPEESTTYHTSWSGPAFLRVFKANPPCAPGDAELTFDIEKGKTSKVLGAVARLKAEFGMAW